MTAAEISADPRTVYLADYQPYPFHLDQVRLTFRLAPRATRVLAALSFTPNPARPGRHDLWLNGENLRLISARINGQPGLVLAADGKVFQTMGLEIEAGRIAAVYTVRNPEKLAGIS